jgi:enoyl-[acyl-carrier protein] reductase I
MGILSGKTALIFGLSNDRSIAWGITQALHREGATLGFSCQAIMEKRARPLVQSLGATFYETADASIDEELDRVFARAKDTFGTIDIVVHSMAYAPNADLEGRFVDTSRAGFHVAQDVSVYSLIALAQRAAPLMPNGGSIITLTYYGGEKVVPTYKVMGVAKAALDMTVRYLADDLGPQGIRVNAISAGPIRTLAASGLKGFREHQKSFAGSAPLRRNVTIEDIGNTAAFLCSDGGRGITGDVIHVDSGYNIMGMLHIEE